MKSCPVCGAEASDTNVFCPNCGAKFPESEASETEVESSAQAVMQEEPPAAPGYTPPQRQPEPEPQQAEPPRQAAQPPISMYAGYSQGYGQGSQQPPRSDYAYAPAPAKDPNAPMNTWGYALALFLFGLPLIGLVIQIVWAAGAVSNINRRNLARGYLFLRCCLAVLVLLGVVVALALMAPLLRRFINEFGNYFNYMPYFY